MKKRILKRFRLIGILEGVIYLTLIFIAMPMKYIMKEPIYVEIIGTIHGIIYIFFVFTQATFSATYRLNIKENSIYFIASLIPFGTVATYFKLKNLENK